MKKKLQRVFVILGLGILFTRPIVTSTSDIAHSQIVVGVIYDQKNGLYTLRMVQHTHNSSNINLYEYIGMAGNYVCGYHFSTK